MPRRTPSTACGSSSRTRRTDVTMQERAGPAGVPVMARPGPAVQFGPGRRPETATTVQVAEFDGPLALLLALIEARQLDILTVPLGGLADAYLDALATLEADRLGNISSFVAVASQLILIKSRAMLPRRAPHGARRPARGRARPRGGAPCSPDPVPGASRRGSAARRRRTGPGRPVPPRTRGGASVRDGRRATDGRPRARPRPTWPGAGASRDDRAATAASARGHAADHHPHRARRDHPGRAARCADRSSSRSSWPVFATGS